MDIGFDSQARSIASASASASTLRSQFDTLADPTHIPEISINDKDILGHPLAQVDNRYIIAQNGNDIMVIDQYTAHESLISEKIKQNLSFTSKSLPVSEVVELGEERVQHILTYESALKKLGMLIERNGVTQVVIRQIPVFIEATNVAALLKDLAEIIISNKDVDIFSQSTQEVCELLIRHSHIRADRQLTINEMSSFLREVESILAIPGNDKDNPIVVKLGGVQLVKIFQAI